MGTCNKNYMPWFLKKWTTMPHYVSSNKGLSRSMLHNVSWITLHSSYLIDLGKAPLLLKNGTLQCIISYLHSTSIVVIYFKQSQMFFDITIQIRHDFTFPSVLLAPLYLSRFNAFHCSDETVLSETIGEYFREN